MTLQVCFILIRRCHRIKRQENTILCLQCKRFTANIAGTKTILYLKLKFKVYLFVTSSLTFTMQQSCCENPLVVTFQHLFGYVEGEISMANSPNLHIFCTVGGNWSTRRETHADTGRMCKLHTDSDPAGNRTQVPWRCEAAVLTTVPPLRKNILNGTINWTLQFSYPARHGNRSGRRAGRSCNGPIEFGGIFRLWGKRGRKILPYYSSHWKYIIK